MFSKLSPTTIVLSIVALLGLIVSLSQPALSVRTGYVYGPNENPTAAEQYSDLKCTYLIAGIKHTRLMKLMLEDRHLLTKAINGIVYKYQIQRVMNILLRRTEVKIDSLWLLLFYVNTVQHSYEHSVANRNVNEAASRAIVDRLLVVNDYVVDIMQKELSTAGCRPGNPFDTYENWYSQKTAATPNRNLAFYDIKMETLKNCNELKSLLDHNCAPLRNEALTSNYLFLDNLGINTELKSKLMTRYDVQIIWSATSEMLVEDLQYAQNMLSPTVTVHPLFSIKKYYTGVFSLFKCIMYRLTWKFLLYVHKFTGESRENYLKKWHDLLVEFQKLLCIEDDPETMSLLGAIDRLSRNDLAVTDVIEPISHRLHSFNVILLCKATNAMTLQPDKEAIEYDSLTNARAFIVDLRFAFRKVDFHIIRSIMLYINEVDKW